ncbi:MAG: hypothetical protein H6845_02125 [Alphaproteobacteria bacterium]|nr:MAG: hypothetical protein H6845_02125 [Alphaproteobacteria bacterium]
MIVLSTISSFMFSSFKLLMNYQKARITLSRVENIYNALSLFVSTNGYLPLPSSTDNFGYTSNSELKDDLLINQSKQSISLCTGIVPFKTIGLTEQDVQDGNGHYFTYVVNPNLCKRSGYTYLPHTEYRIKFDTDNETENVCGFCTSRFYCNLISIKQLTRNAISNLSHVVNKSRSVNSVVNYRSPISDLCCWINQFAIIDGNDDVSSYVKNFYYYIDFFSKKGLNIVRNDSDCMEPRHEAHKVCDSIAIVLVSHGDNGGYFLRDGSRANVKCRSMQKRENASASLKFYLTGCKAEGFDDKVFYISKFQFAKKYMNLICESHILFLQLSA